MMGHHLHIIKYGDCCYYTRQVYNLQLTTTITYTYRSENIISHRKKHIQKKKMMSLQTIKRI